MSEQTITLDELAEQTQNLRESSKSDAKRREGQQCNTQKYCPDVGFDL
jgi:hypothetical protein